MTLVNNNEKIASYMLTKKQIENLRIEGFNGTYRLETYNANIRDAVVDYDILSVDNEKF